MVDSEVNKKKVKIMVRITAIFFTTILVFILLLAPVNRLGSHYFYWGASFPQSITELVILIIFSIIVSTSMVIKMENNWK
jgi:succinate dehydrogenase hydrophobic anchor subunit